MLIRRRACHAQERVAIDESRLARIEVRDASIRPCTKAVETAGDGELEGSRRTPNSSLHSSIREAWDRAKDHHWITNGKQRVNKKLDTIKK